MEWLRALALALTLAAGLVAVDGVAASSTAPRPDPPPVKKTPPPPIYRAPPPPVYQAPPPPVYQAPPPPVYQAPPATGPSAAQVLAAQRAAAREKAERRAVRLKKRRQAEKRRAAKKREARTRAAAKLSASRQVGAKREVARAAFARRLSSADRGGRAGEAVSVALPFVIAATVAALLILALGLVPEYVVSRHRMSAVLEDHRGHFTLVAGMAILGSAIFFALTFLS